MKLVTRGPMGREEELRAKGVRKSTAVLFTHKRKSGGERSGKVTKDLSDDYEKPQKTEQLGN